MPLPSHPETYEPEPARSANTVSVVIIAAVAIVIAALVILHLTGVVGPGA